MTDKKYRLTDITKILDDGTRLYRICATRDLMDITKGDIGGWIEKEDNLSQAGNCWVFADSIIRGNAKVRDDARIYGQSTISDNVWLYGETSVKNCDVYGNAIICDGFIRDKEDYIEIDGVTIYQSDLVHPHQISGHLKVATRHKIYDVDHFIHQSLNLQGFDLIHRKRIVRAAMIYLENRTIPESEFEKYSKPIVDANNDNNDNEEYVSKIISLLCKDTDKGMINWKVKEEALFVGTRIYETNYNHVSVVVGMNVNKNMEDYYLLQVDDRSCDVTANDIKKLFALIEKHFLLQRFNKMGIPRTDGGNWA